MDDLISRKAAIEAIKELLYEPDSVQYIWSSDALSAVKHAHSVPAVPLDKLCEWLSDHAGRPIDCQDHLCGKCEFDDVGVGQEMCWKALITKWMEEEEHNGTDNP